MNGILAALEPAKTVFQSREMGCHRAMPILNAVKTPIERYRSTTKFQYFIKQASDSWWDKNAGKLTELMNSQWIDAILKELNDRFTKNN